MELHEQQGQGIGAIGPAGGSHAVIGGGQEGASVGRQAVWSVANPDPYGLYGDGNGIGCES